MSELHKIASDCASTPAEGRVPFGLDREKTAQILRNLADALESPRTVFDAASVIGVEQTTTALADDYCLTRLSINFAIRRERPDAG